MGFFSWLDCNTKRQVKIGDPKAVYVLIPKEFGSGHIAETYYNGYGRFGGLDIYELVAIWNRKYITENNLMPVQPREKFGGLYSFEIDKLKEQGKTQEEIDEIVEASRDKYYGMALRRHQREVDRLNDYTSEKYTDDEMEEKYGRDWLREIGIDIGCYDEQNSVLKYPIKISHNSKAVYENCPYSLSDENQGC